MYPIFKSERALADVTLEELASATGVTVSTVSGKLSGLYQLTLKDAIAYKKVLGTKVILEDLFLTREEVDERIALGLNYRRVESEV